MTAAPGGLRPSLTLFGEDRLPLAVADAPAGGQEASVTWLAPGSHRYYVLVAAVDAGSQGEYTVSISLGSNQGHNLGDNDDDGDNGADDGMGDGDTNGNDDEDDENNNGDHGGDDQDGEPGDEDQADDDGGQADDDEDEQHHDPDDPTIATASDSAGRLTIVRADDDGHPVVYLQDGLGSWISFRPTDLAGGPAPSGRFAVWADPKDDRPYLVSASDEGLALYRHAEDGSWSVRNLSAELRGQAIAGDPVVLTGVDPTGGWWAVADDALRLLAGSEEGDRRDAHDLERVGDLRVLVDVDLHDVDRAVVLGGELLHLRRDQATRPAPGGPEVDEHGLVALEDLLLERRVTDRDRLTHASSLLVCLVGLRAPHHLNISWWADRSTAGSTPSTGSRSASVLAGSRLPLHLAVLAIGLALRTAELKRHSRDLEALTRQLEHRRCIGAPSAQSGRDRNALVDPNAPPRRAGRGFCKPLECRPHEGVLGKPLDGDAGIEPRLQLDPVMEVDPLQERGDLVPARLEHARRPADEIGLDERKKGELHGVETSTWDGSTVTNGFALGGNELHNPPPHYVGRTVRYLDIDRGHHDDLRARFAR